MLTLKERLGTTDGKKFLLTWTYHPKPLKTAVANSALIIAAKFGFDSSALSPEAKSILDAFVQKLVAEVPPPPSPLAWPMVSS